MNALQITESHLHFDAHCSCDACVAHRRTVHLAETTRAWLASQPQVSRRATHPTTSESWIAYFKANASNLSPIPWWRGTRATSSQLAAIKKSIQEFQLGESGEGVHLLRCAQEYAKKSGDHAYVNAVKWLISEEHRHAYDLGRFMDSVHIARIRHAWPDAIFRWLRHRGGLELSIAVLVTAEVIAKVYYAALRDATDSLALRRICEQTLRDEVQHVRFQCERLAILRRARSPRLVSWCRRVHEMFFAITLMVVWHKHGRAMRAGGYSWRRFRQAARYEMHSAMEIADPGRYCFDGAPSAHRRSVATTSGSFACGFADQPPPHANDADSIRETAARLSSPKSSEFEIDSAESDSSFNQP